MFTLVDLSKQEEEPLRKGIILDLLRYAPVLEILPFETVNSLDVIAARWKDLPDTEFRRINEGYSESSGHLEQVNEKIALLGGDVDMDVVFEAVTNVIEKPAVTQTKMKVKSAAYRFNTYFIDGGPVYDADGFYGLDYRVGLLGARQRVALGAAGVTAVDVTATTNNENMFLDGLHRINKMVGGADAYFMNEEMYLGLNSVLRRLGLLDTTKDQFDRDITSFMGARLIDIGLQGDLTTEIITNTNLASDGGADATYIYAVKFGLDDGLVGIQLSGRGPDAYWVGGEGHELESKPAKRLRVDWGVGLAGFGSYYVARLGNILDPTQWS